MTLENINATLGTKFTLIKRDGSINEGNARIAKRLSGLTERDLEEFMRTDEGWNMTPAEKHAKGYHALRALDKWYREHGETPSEEETPSEGMPSEGMPSEGMPSEGEGNGEGESESEGNGNGDSSESSESSEREGNGNGNGEGESEGDGDSSESEGESNGEGEGDSSESNGESESSESESESESEGNGEAESSEEETPSPNVKLTDTEKQVLAMITRPQLDGRPNNVYLHGPAGTGKSYMVKRIAEAIGAGYWETGIVNMKEELLGFTDAGGRYVTPECVKILKDGKEGKKLTIMLFDEFDGMPNGVTLTWNNIFASRRFTTPEGTFNVHPSVRFVATGNTTMDGADEFYDRETVDKSVKTRWLFKAVDYDKKVEKKLADADVVEFLQGLRRAKDNCGLDLLVTYREFTALQWSKAIIADGIMDKESALESCVFKGLSEDDKDTLRNDRMMQKLIEKDNEWAKAL